MGRQTGEILQNYCMFDSVYDGDHDGVVSIFVGLSCEPGRLISCLINYIIIYIAWNNFSPTRSVTSGNRTPGSRFYSDLLDTSVESTSSYSSLVQSFRLLI